VKWVFILSYKECYQLHVCDYKYRYSMAHDSRTPCNTGKEI